MNSASHSHQHRAIAVGVAVALVALAAMGGCAKKQTAKGFTPVQPETTVTQPATQAAETTTTPVSNEPQVGPVHTPEPGTEERQALADAAREKIGTESRFVINQMKSNNVWAVAQLTEKDNPVSYFVAYKNTATGWAAFYSAKVPGQSQAAVKQADSAIAQDVLDAITWKGVSPPTPKPTKPSNSEAIDAAKAVVKKNSPGTPITGAQLLGMTQDNKGRWWAWVLVKGPANVDPLTVYIYKDGASWKLWDFGTEPKRPPSDVKF